jgi:hypothetical protein
MIFPERLIRATRFAFTVSSTALNKTMMPVPACQSLTELADLPALPELSLVAVLAVVAAGKSS